MSDIAIVLFFLDDSVRPFKHTPVSLRVQLCEVNYILRRVRVDFAQDLTLRHFEVHWQGLAVFIVSWRDLQHELF